jgi:hypothetical protein
MTSNPLSSRRVPGWSVTFCERGMVMKKTLMALILVAGLLFSLSPAQAETYTFGQVSGNDPEGFAAQWLRMDVDPVESDQVAFKFYWGIGAIAAYAELGWTSNPVITEVWVFDGGLIDPNATITSTGTVAFEAPATGVFPGGENVGLGPGTAFYSADADNPAPTWGVNLTPADESLTLTFEGDYAAAVAALNAWIGADLATKQGIDWATNETYLAFGLQVQSLGPTGEQSAQFVPVPLPGAVLLLGAGLVRLAAYARRRRREDV